MIEDNFIYTAPWHNAKDPPDSLRALRILGPKNEKHACKPRPEPYKVSSVDPFSQARFYFDDSLRRESSDPTISLLKMYWYMSQISAVCQRLEVSQRHAVGSDSNSMRT